MRLANSATITASVVTSILLLAASSGLAKPLKPGLYSLGSIAQVCLQADGSWFFTTFSGNIGAWLNVDFPDATTIMWGSFNSGTGEDSIIINKGIADWMEFQNNGSLNAFNDRIAFTKLDKHCSRPSKLRTNQSEPMP